jgi:hypothetical protein
MIINKTEISDTSFITNVTYTLADGTEVTVDVTTDSPKSAADVTTDLANREAAEQAKYDADLNNIKAIIDEQVAQPVDIVANQLRARIR